MRHFIHFSSVHMASELSCLSLLDFIGWRISHIDFRAQLSHPPLSVGSPRWESAWPLTHRCCDKLEQGSVAGSAVTWSGPAPSPSSHAVAHRLRPCPGLGQQNPLWAQTMTSISHGCSSPPVVFVAGIPDFHVLLCSHLCPACSWGPRSSEFPASLILILGVCHLMWECLVSPIAGSGLRDDGQFMHLKTWDSTKYN